MDLNKYEAVVYGVLLVLAGVSILAKGRSFMRWDVEWRRRLRFPKWNIAIVEFWGTPMTIIFGAGAILFGLMLFMTGAAGNAVKLGNSSRSHCLEQRNPAFQKENAPAK